VRYCEDMPSVSESAMPAGACTGPAAFAARFAVSPETLARLERYERVLRQWQPAVNLVANGTLAQVWQRHFADSAQLLSLAPTDAHTWLDLGSGGGFPGLVIAILLADGRDRQDRRDASAAGGPPAKAMSPPPVTLIESDARKAAFLREVARHAGIAVDILSTRIELAATHATVPRPDVVTARALAPLDKLLGLAAPFFSKRSIGLFLKGREAVREVEAARKVWIFNSELIRSCTDPKAHIVRVSALEPNRKEPRS